MGYEYALKTNKDTGDVMHVLENEWIKRLLDKDKLVSKEFSEEIVRCTLLHGYDANGNDGFSFCDPMTPVGRHEIIQLSPLWDERGNPYVYIYCHDKGETSTAFFEATKIILQNNTITYSICELED